MRMPKQLSPSGIKTWAENRDEFYLRYLSDNRPDRAPQTLPMSVGSAFDAYVKSFLYERLIGKKPEYDFDTLFIKQVEAHNRDWAKEAGAHVFERYKTSGALVDLMQELQKSVGPPRFEFEISGFVRGSLGGTEVPMTGRPDIFFINEQGARVIYDWKVNGYCSKSPVSPKAGYVKVRDGWGSTEKKASRNNHMPHPDCYPTDMKGIKINPFLKMQDVDADWANQLHVYAWLLGEAIGSDDLILGIDQVACAPGESKPWLRVASHRTQACAEYQYFLLAKIEEIWSCITSGHIYSELTREQSDEKCASLNTLGTQLASGDEFAGFVNTVSRE